MDDYVNDIRNRAQAMRVRLRGADPENVCSATHWDCLCTRPPHDDNNHYDPLNGAFSKTDHS